MDTMSAMHRFFPVVTAAGVFLIFACVAAIAKEQPRLNMFGATVVAKERIEPPNTDDRDVVVLKRNFYLTVSPNEVNYIDEQCRTCIPASAESIEADRITETERRASLARLFAVILICAFGAGIVQYIAPTRIPQKPSGFIRIRNGSKNYRDDPQAQRELYKRFERT
jgi:hypothetical protein